MVKRSSEKEALYPTREQKRTLITANNLVESYVAQKKILTTLPEGSKRHERVQEIMESLKREFKAIYQKLSPEQRVILERKLDERLEDFGITQEQLSPEVDETQATSSSEEEGGEVVSLENKYTHLLDNPRDIRKVQEQLFIKKTGERLKKERSTINRVSGVIEDTFIKNPRFENLARAWQNTMRGNGGDVGVLALLEQIEKIEKNPRSSLQGSVEKIADEVRSMLDGLKRRFETALKNKEMGKEEYQAVVNFIERIYPQESPLEEDTEEVVLEAAA